MMQEMAERYIDTFFDAAPRFRSVQCPECGTQEAIHGIFGSDNFHGIRFVNFDLHAFCAACRRVVVLRRIVRAPAEQV